MAQNLKRRVSINKSIGKHLQFATFPVRGIWVKLSFWNLPCPAHVYGSKKISKNPTWHVCSREKLFCKAIFYFDVYSQKIAKISPVLYYKTIAPIHNARYIKNDSKAENPKANFWPKIRPNFKRWPQKIIFELKRKNVFSQSLFSAHFGKYRRICARNCHSSTF